MPRFSSRRIKRAETKFEAGGKNETCRAEHFVADGAYRFKFEEYGVKRRSKIMGMMLTGDEVTINFHMVAGPA